MTATILFQPLALSAAAPKAKKKKTVKKTSAQKTVNKPDADLDANGSPDKKLFNVGTARYYVWHTRDGWHLRSAAKNIVAFHGSIKLTNATFARLRPFALEKKGKYADKWSVNKERTEVHFVIYTSTSFDGFDFSVRAKSDAKVEFELLLGQSKRRMPNRIFIGRNGDHPRAAKLSLPTKPDQPTRVAPKK